MCSLKLTTPRTSRSEQRTGVNGLAIDPFSEPLMPVLRPPIRRERDDDDAVGLQVDGEGAGDVSPALYASECHGTLRGSAAAAGGGVVGNPCVPACAVPPPAPHGGGMGVPTVWSPAMPPQLLPGLDMSPFGWQAHTRGITNAAEAGLTGLPPSGGADIGATAPESPSFAWAGLIAGAVGEASPAAARVAGGSTVPLRTAPTVSAPALTFAPADGGGAVTSPLAAPILGPARGSFLGRSASAGAGGGGSGGSGSNGSGATTSPSAIAGVLVSNAVTPVGAASAVMAHPHATTTTAGALLLAHRRPSLEHDHPGASHRTVPNEMPPSFGMSSSQSQSLLVDTSTFSGSAFLVAPNIADIAMTPMLSTPTLFFGRHRTPMAAAAHDGAGAVPAPQPGATGSSTCGEGADAVRADTKHAAATIAETAAGRASSEAH